ncbi:MAG: PIN domain-containing protein [Flavobacteriales bacterium]|jgi:predicted nucleic acid-binding protein|nr:PIN domain-containing protein [Flavobacteriales bacterium]MBK7941155.1 PIN domain-containing protein [Flavobacteriales bacterium]MBK9701181.1 PIN domain-containing protein [Flavobacteriales bacterium]
MSSSIKDQCIRLRSEYRMKLADALIGATAISLGLPLITADKGFKRLDHELHVIVLDPTTK